MIDINDFDAIRIGLASSEADPRLVVGRGHQAGDDQLPHAQARAGRSLLRAHLRSDEGLGVLLRQVQARPLQGHHLRALRRRGDAPEGAPRAHGSHRPGRARLAHLVLQGRPEPDRLPARHRAARAREGPVLRRLDRHRRRRREARRRTSPTSRTRCAAESEQIYVDRDEQLLARRGAAHAPPRLLRGRQGEELRRGRRVLGPRAQQLGRGSAAADARGGPQARRRHLPDAREVARRPRTRKKIRELVRQTATRDDRQLAPRELESVATAAQEIHEALDPLRAELEKASGSKKGAITKHLHKLRRGAARPATELSGRRRRARRRASTRRTSSKAREIGNGLLRRRARRGRTPAPTRDEVRELAYDLCLVDGAQKDDLDVVAPVGAQGARDGTRTWSRAARTPARRPSRASAGSRRRGSCSASSSRSSSSTTSSSSAS